MEKRRAPRQSTPQKLVCLYCQQKLEVDFKDVSTLRKFVTERGRIYSKSRSGLCAKHQRQVALAVKRARHLALLPFIVRV
ncbi:MAG TPA: 30S ribosomal protein S18 [Patescibacteria group bacterium]